jgi:hypothetical protein
MNSEIRINKIRMYLKVEIIRHKIWEGEWVNIREKSGNNSKDKNRENKEGNNNNKESNNNNNNNNNKKSNNSNNK